MTSRHLILILSLLLSGCTGRPAVLEGPDYALASESADFSDPGLEQRFECRPLKSQTDFLGGLSPRQPIAECRHENIPNPPGTPSYEGRPKLDKRGLTLHYSTYLVKSGTELSELGTLEALRQAYAPIESPAEALSLTLASMPNLRTLTATAVPSPPHNLGPSEQILVPSGPNVVYRLNTLQGTGVSARGEDFLISSLLFDGECNRHDSITVAYSVDYLVTRTGQIREQGRKPVFELGPCPIE